MARDDHDGAAFRIRRARTDEAAELSALALRSKGVWGYDAAFLEACRAELTVAPETIRASAVWVAEAEGRILGLYSLEDVRPDQVELGLLYVEPAALGRGVGSRLLAHAVAEARALGCGRLVIQGDPNAAPFYLRHGAVRMGSRPSGSVPGRQLPLFHLALR